MKNKVNPKSLLRKIREQAMLEAVQGEDGQAYVAYESAGVKLATPIESTQAIPLIKDTVSRALDLNLTRSEVKDLIESMQGELLTNPGKKWKILPRVGSGEKGPEILLSPNHGKVAQFSEGGYKIVKGGSATFINSPSADHIPKPVKLKDIKQGIKLFRKILRLPKEDCILVILWILHTYLPTGPYLLLIISGESGVGKSILTECIRSLVDPSTVPTIGCPSNDRMLFGAARYNHIIAIDNATELKPKVLDNLCRMSTGGGISIRKGSRLADEEVYGACRPIILNGIARIGLRNDVLQRSIVIEVGRATSQKDIEFFMAKFNAARPKILGSLFQAVAHGLSKIDEVDRESEFRMAGFVAWSIAAGSAFGWSEEKIRTVYADNQREAFLMLAESDPLLVAISDLIHREGEWHGTASELLSRVKEFALRQEGNVKGLPKSANALSARLRVAREALLAFGIDFDKGRPGGGTVRLIHLTLVTGTETN